MREQRHPRRPRLGRLGRLGFAPARAGALLGLLAGILALYGLTSASAFAIRRIEVSPVTWTDEATVLRALAVYPGGNAFSLPTADLAERILQLPSVATASVSVALPDALRVEVTERVPVLAWRVGDSTFVVDRDGLVFAISPHNRPVGPDGRQLPIVIDTRVLSRTVVGVGSWIDPIDLDAATRLASLVPADVGSSAPSLVVRIDDADGWIVTPNPATWLAVFGPYSAILRTPDLITGQVRLLRSLIAGREGQFARITLADGEHGTYLPAPSGG